MTNLKELVQEFLRWYLNADIVEADTSLSGREFQLSINGVTCIPNPVVVVTIANSFHPPIFMG